MIVCLLAVYAELNTGGLEPPVLMHPVLLLSHVEGATAPEPRVPATALQLTTHTTDQMSDTVFILQSIHKL